jgi:hypothetical protein
MDTRGATAITAEIPAVPVAPAYGVLLPDGSIWYPGSKRKLPAPSLLRVIVWTLTLLVLLTGAALVVEHFQPSWFNSIRRVVGPPGVLSTGSPGATTTTRPGTGTGSSSGKMRQTGQGFNSVVYSLPGAPYVLTIKTTQRCYVQVRSLANGTSLFSEVIGAGVTQTVTVRSGSATLEAYAGGSSLSVGVNGTQVGSIAKLLYAVVYKFNPPGT